jgi:hypothetical protein
MPYLQLSLANARIKVGRSDEGKNGLVTSFHSLVEVATFASNCLIVLPRVRARSNHLCTFVYRCIRPSAPAVNTHGCVGWNTQCNTPSPPVILCPFST